VTGLLVTLMTVTGIALAGIPLRARDEHYRLPPVNERMMYLRSGRTADRLALSFDNLAADVYWIRTLQHYGRDYKNRSRQGRFELLPSLLDLTTTLDPHFLIAYRFGAIFLALAPPDGPGRPDLAIALLEKGLAVNPDRWQLAHDIAFTHLLYTGDNDAARRWFERTAAMTGAPEWIGPLAAVTTARGGDRQAARRMLNELRTTQENYIRRAAERILVQLDGLDRVDEVEKQVAVFRERTGRDPSGWPEMIAAGVIGGIPVDPAGTPLVYDSASRRVSMAETSPLMPLPPMLKGK
jgi:hypothetical protein